MMIRGLSILFFLTSPVTSFVLAGSRSPNLKNLAATTATEDDITNPSYEIEQIPVRIGHGFDIHRMAPIEEAGQPVVIGGVEIPHKDQKVSDCIFFFSTLFVHCNHLS